MDLAMAECKRKLVYLRIKDLKDVLFRLGLSKQGKKQDLIDRILANISYEQGPMTAWAKMKNEDVTKMVNDAYRKLNVSGIHNTPAIKDLSVISNVNRNNVVQESFRKIRCLCRISLGTMDPLVQCDDPSCKVWQHISCAVIPDKLMKTVPVPDLFFCEICRVARADPFRVSIAHPLYPVKLSSTNISSDRSKPVQIAERTFQLTKVFKDLLCKPEYDIQSWCMLLNDQVPFRMQWPQYAELLVNGVPVHTTNRPGSQLLGVSGRDDGPIITRYTKDGVNKITLTVCDARIFCVGVRIIKRRTLQQILKMIPKESEGESFEDALTRVRRCIGGGTATAKTDSDSDLEIVADSILVNLCCPMSASRIRVAGRFKPCAHMGCFDLHIFLEMSQRTRKWYCPICLTNYSFEDLVIDPYFNRITSALIHYGPDHTEVEVHSDGSWRSNPADGWNPPYGSNEEPLKNHPVFSEPEKYAASPGSGVSDKFTDSDAERENPVVIVLTDSDQEEAGPGFRVMGPVTGPVSLIPDASVDLSGPEVDGDLVDNPLFCGADPSLQLLLPVAHGSAHTHLRKRVEASENLISLRLGGNLAQVDDPHPEPRFSFSFEVTDPVIKEMLLEPWNNGGELSEADGRLRYDVPLSFPRQRRSVRPRLGF